MRKSFVLAVALAAWSCPPWPGSIIATGAIATVSLVAGSQAEAGTAVQPGWARPCGPNPRCFEQGEARRQAAWRRARLAAWRQ